MFLKRFFSAAVSCGFSAAVAAVFVAVFFLSAQTASAALQPLTGFARSETIGWLSFNSTNPNAGGGPHKVEVDDLNGNLSGYAWSENIGWVSFNAADVAGCPVGSCTPNVSLTTGVVSGWVRACAGKNESTPLVAGFTVGATAPRNNYTGFVGTMITVGSSPLTVTELGRYMLAGNSGTHTVKLVQHNGWVEIPGGSVSISMSGGTVGQFKYATLASPITLAAGTSYYILSQEISGGDTWHHSDTIITPTGAASINFGMYGNVGGYSADGGSNNSFGPVNLRYLNGLPINQTLPNNTCSGISRTDGWDGWIELSGNNHESGGGNTVVTYNSPNFVSSPTTGKTGVTYNTSTGLFSGVAWGSDVVGWMDFSGIVMNGRTLVVSAIDGTNGDAPLPAVSNLLGINSTFVTANSYQQVIASGALNTIANALTSVGGLVVTAVGMCTDTGATSCVPLASNSPSWNASRIGLGWVTSGGYNQYIFNNTLSVGTTRVVFKYGYPQPTVTLRAAPGGGTLRDTTSNVILPNQALDLQWDGANIQNCKSTGGGTTSWGPVGPAFTDVPRLVNDTLTYPANNSISVTTVFTMTCTDINAPLNNVSSSVTVPVMTGWCKAYSDAAGLNEITTASVGTPIWWIAKPQPETDTYNYIWSGSDNLVASNLVANPSEQNKSVKKTYRTIGSKNALVTITNTRPGSQDVPCAAVNIYLNVKPTAKEF